MVKRNIFSKIGAIAALGAFLTTGLIPASVYGGYMGLMLSHVLFGSDIGALNITRFMTGGGIILGIVAIMSLYIVLGSVAGGALGHVYDRFVKTNITTTPNNINNSVINDT